MEIPRGSWGWAVLGLVLLVPILGFWKWWAGINVRHAGNKLSKTSPPAFAGVSNVERNSNLTRTTTSVPSPVTLSTATPALAVAGSVPPAVPSGPIQEYPATTAMTASKPPVSTSTNSAVVPLVADTAGYNPKTDRDPMISPRELAQIKMMEESARHPVQGPSRHEGRIEDRIHLNGIVAADENSSAIINGRLVRVRGVILGARIVEITQTCVKFEYKTRTFSKCIKK